VHGLEHGVPAAGVGAAGGADAALNLGGLICDDVTVEIWQYKYLKFAADFRVHQIGGHDVDVPVLGGDLRVLRRDLVADSGEAAIGFLHDIGLGDNSYVGFSVGAGKGEGRSGNAPGPGVRCDLEIHGQLAGNFNAPAPKGVFALGVFPEEGPVNARLRDGDRPHIGVEVQLPAHGHVGAFQRAALGGLRGAFQKHIAGFDSG